MAHAYIEHANITVADPERTAAMLSAVFGWEERWRGPSALGGWTIHVGSDTHYLAVYTRHSPHDAAGAEPLRHAKGAPLNHLGLVVDDLDDVERRVVDAGYQPFNHADYEPGRRFYFYDENGIEFEIASYTG